MQNTSRIPTFTSFTMFRVCLILQAGIEWQQLGEFSPDTWLFLRKVNFEGAVLQQAEGASTALNKTGSCSGAVAAFGQAWHAHGRWMAV